jgi:hypothetical protein
MKQYERIFVPRNAKEHGVTMDDNYRVQHYGFAGPTNLSIEVEPQQNVIVLTVEELREVCKAMVSEWIEVNGNGSIDADLEKDLHNYLQSKGIKI